MTALKRHLVPITGTRCVIGSCWRQLQELRMDWSDPPLIHHQLKLPSVLESTERWDLRSPFPVWRKVHSAASAPFPPGPYPDLQINW